MKSNLIIAVFFALFCAAKSQTIDSVYQQRVLPKTEIDAVFSYYDQDGEHSAVTGGEGTEALHVFATSVTVTKNYNAQNSATYSLGVDVITSASTDMINAVISSASYQDNRTHGNVGYQRKSKNTRLLLGAGTGFSIESDYFSIPALLTLSYTTPDKMRTYDVALQAFFDDLRWGRVNPDYYYPVKLIYPSELRFTDWFDIYRRNTFSGQLGVSQIVNKRLVVGVYPQVVYQKGLLSTPFHRVFFNNNTARVENLPTERIKLQLGLNGKYFTTGNVIVKPAYRFYWDTWGILAQSLELEASIKVKPLFIVSPFLRVYQQSATPYFKPYGAHDPSESFYTSDYDLSKFMSYKLGFGLTSRTNYFVGNRLSFSNIGLRYSYYRRSDHLYAHIISLVMHLATAPKIKD